MGLLFKKGCNVTKICNEMAKELIKYMESNLIQGNKDKKQENHKSYYLCKINIEVNVHHWMSWLPIIMNLLPAHFENLNITVVINGSELQHYWAVTSMLWILKQLYFFFFFLFTYVVLFISITYEQWTCSPNDEHFYQWIISTHSPTGSQVKGCLCGHRNMPKWVLLGGVTAEWLDAYLWKNKDGKERAHE